MSSSKKTTSQQVQSNRLDPAQMSLFMDNYGKANAIADRPFMPFSGELVAGFTPAGLLAQDMVLREAPGAGAGTMRSAVDAAQRAAAYRPLQFGDVPQARPVFARAAQAHAVPASASARVEAAQLDRGAIRDLATETGLGGLDAWLNPHTQAVIDAAMSDLARGRDIARNAGMAQAAATPGAFSNARRGVEDAETNRAFLDAVARTSAQLRAQGFDSAAGLLMNDRGRKLQANSANQAADLRAAEQNAGFSQQANMRNAEAADVMARFNAGLLSDTARFNAGNAQAADLSNADAANRSALANQEAVMRARLADQAADQSGARLGFDSAALLGSLSQQELAQLLARAGAIGGVGDAQQAQNQAGLDAARAEFMRAWDYPLLQQQLRNQALGLIPLQQTMTSNGKTVEKSNPGAMGIMMGLGSLARGLGTGGLGWTPFG